MCDNGPYIRDDMMCCVCVCVMSSSFLLKTNEAGVVCEKAYLSNVSGRPEALALWSFGLPDDNDLFAAAGCVLQVHGLQFGNQSFGPLRRAAKKFFVAAPGHKAVYSLLSYMLLLLF